MTLPPDLLDRVLCADCLDGLRERPKENGKCSLRCWRHDARTIWTGKWVTMPDVVVTVPQKRYAAWLAEGDLPGEAYSGRESFFHLGGCAPDVKPGERVYIVAQGKLRGYSPLVRLERTERGCELVRHGDAVACTLPDRIVGFRGFRYRWWSYAEELAVDKESTQEVGLERQPALLEAT